MCMISIHRQLGKAKSTRGRINGNNFADGEGDKEMDALDKALGIGGNVGGGITPRPGSRVVKVSFVDTIVFSMSACMCAHV